MRVLILVVLVGFVAAPPPQRSHAQQAQAQAEKRTDAEDSINQQDQQQNQNEQQPGQKPMYEFTYSKYLEEVVKILESDPKFTEKLKQMPEADIKAGKIADHIDVIGDDVFDKLHKVKLQEIERLRVQIEEQIKADGGAHNVKMPEHLDVNQWEKFGKEDLRKLIQKTVADMDEIDRQRRDDFKEYELKKKAEEDHRLAQMNAEEKARAEQEAAEARKRMNDHEKLNHPGGRDQLEEVWSETDQMPKDTFDPKTFFNLHDLNGDGFWNEDELEALFQLELAKMYNESDPNYDPRERLEEMYRMREHVTKQIDKNNDRLISLQEFLQDTEAQDPDKQDSGWDDLQNQKVYTDEELKKFEEEYAKEMGWGEHAYESTPAAPTTSPQPAAAHNEVKQEIHVPAQPAQPNHNANANPNQQQAVHNQQVPPVHQQPIVDAPKDPTYGI